MQKKYQVFVSSTFTDLVDERQEVIRAILDMGQIPAGMELFPAADTQQLEYIKKVIDECDYYILILGGRYGSLDNEGVSFTEREYDYAVKSGKTVLAFPHANTADIPVGKSDVGDRMRDNLEQFRSKVMEGRLVKSWNTKEQLQSLVIIALNRAFTEDPAVGWVRGNAVASEDILQQLNGLRLANEKLQEQNRDLISAQRPKLEGLAQGEEVISLRFNHREQSRSGYTDRVKNFDFTWNEIFLLIATHLNLGRVSELIKSYFADYIKEGRGLTTHYSIFDHDLAVVKNQLVALNLIKVSVSKATDGKIYEFMNLTAVGKALLAESLAVKSSVS